MVFLLQRGSRRERPSRTLASIEEHRRVAAADGVGVI
jgi:hypothetical protein